MVGTILGIIIILSAGIWFSLSAEKGSKMLYAFIGILSSYLPRFICEFIYVKISVWAFPLNHKLIPILSLVTLLIQIISVLIIKRILDKQKHKSLSGKIFRKTFFHYSILFTFYIFSVICLSFINNANVSNGKYSNINEKSKRHGIERINTNEDDYRHKVVVEEKYIKVLTPTYNDFKWFIWMVIGLFISYFIFTKMETWNTIIFLGPIPIPAVFAWGALVIGCGFFAITIILRQILSIFFVFGANG